MQKKNRTELDNKKARAESIEKKKKNRLYDIMLSSS